MRNLPSHSVLALVVSDEPGFYADVFTMRPVARETRLPRPGAASDFRERGLRLRYRGYTPIRTFKRLRREYPGSEWYELKRAAGLNKPTFKQPLWTSIGRPPINPVSVRIDPRRQAKTVPVTVTTISWEELMTTFPIQKFERELRQAYERARIKHKKQAEENAARFKILQPQIQAQAMKRLAEIKREVRERHLVK